MAVVTDHHKPSPPPTHSSPHLLSQLTTSSFLIEQGLALPIRRLGMSNTAEQAVPTVVLGSRNIDRSDQEDREDDKGKDPLQSNDLDRELAQCQC